MAANTTAKGPTAKSAAKAEEKPVETPAVADTSVYKGDMPFAKELFVKAEEYVANFANAHTTLEAANGDKEKAFKAFIESSQMPEAVAIRLEIEAANKRLAELAEENVKVVTLSPEELEKLKTTVSTYREEAKSAIDAIEGVSKMMPMDQENIAAAIKTLRERMPASNRGRKPGSAGSSLPRPRVNLTVTGGNLTDAPYDSFSKLAMHLSCEALDLQQAYAKAAGVPHEEISNVKKSVTFNFQANENGSTYIINVTPKETAKTGPKPAQTETAKTEGEDSSETEVKSDESAPAA